ncbi:BPTI/Kunitz inhibitor domain-containing protein [Meloidogyne graminicola]|uniref:BPTI/Kunitz inhibitor domain-containing protein n=1 Tax=Meloidogyne graminicola TaxID=189291 RepID=A0A8S9ZFE6_9BILA|nr:BPTI/Kunitz inhibitor domain-containing protein [Meloidogyne graminicola]
MLSFIAFFPLFLLLLEYKHCNEVELQIAKKRQNANVKKPFSGKLCNASYRPNLPGELLEKCYGELKKCKNSNNFYCKRSTGYCCPKKEFVCQSSADSGHEINEQKQFLHSGRFAFEKELKDCKTFCEEK